MARRRPGVMMYGFHQESSFFFTNAVEKARVNGCFSLSGGRPR